MTYEHSEIAMLDSGTIHDVLSVQLHRFQQRHAALPEIIFLNSNLRMAFTLELMKITKLSAQEATTEPVWIQGFGRTIPLLYSHTLGEDYMLLLNRSIAAKTAL